MTRKTSRIIFRLAGFIISSFLLVAVTLILARAMNVRNGPDLQWWHSEEISSEFSLSGYPAVSTLDQYLAKEEVVFNELQILIDDNAHLQQRHHLVLTS
jgi:hypothetical protein